MFYNLLITAFRNLKKNKVYSAINIIGFALGLAGCLLILLYVYNEVSYENIHKNKDSIYRVGVLLKHGEHGIPFAAGMPPLAPALQEMFPEVENFVRIRQTEQITVSLEDSDFIEEKFVYAENSLFQLFSFHLEKGDIGSALLEPYSMILSQKSALKYFGKIDPMGKILTIDGAHDFTVKGVLSEYKGNSQLNFDLIASYTSLEGMGQYSGAWGQFGTDHNFIQLAENTSEEQFKEKLPQVITQNVNSGLADIIELELQPFNKIYFNSKMNNEFTPSGDLQKVYLFIIIAAIIMFIACLNFINLSTARSIQRSKEVGVRKIFGSKRSQLMNQFIFESVFMTLAATIIGLIIFRFLYPLLNNFIGRELPIFYFTNPLNILILIVTAIAVGILSGIYPAFFLSRFDPANTIRSGKGKTNTIFRKIIVIIQFSLAVILIIATLIVFKQLHYVKNVDLGFEKENKIVVSMEEDANTSHFEILKKEFLKLSQVTAVTNCFSAPGSSSIMMMNTMEENKTMDDAFMISAITCDYDYLSLFKIEVIEGRDFSSEQDSDITSSIILNKAAVETFGFEKPLGKKIMIPGENHELIPAEVIGVVGNFKYRSLKEEVTPLMLYNSPSTFGNIVIDYNGEETAQLVGELKEIWGDVNSDLEFNFSFLEVDYNSLYEAEEKMGQLFVFFSLLILFIACMGIFGLTSFMAEQRTKEIGIRKVLGADNSQIIALLTQNFLKWVLLANVIAIPVAVFLMRKWLEDFSYRTELNPWIFFTSAGISLIIAFITISFQSYKAASQNPVSTLKYE